MISFRKPKGTYTRSTSDWFTDQMAGAGGLAPLVGGSDGVISLYNNASDGSSLLVYTIAILSGAGSVGFFYQLKGTDTTLLGPGFPIQGDLPMPWGQVYQGYVPNGTQFPSTAPFIPLGFAAQPPSSGGPLAIVRPGYRLCTQSQGDIRTSFTYCQLRY